MAPPSCEAAWFRGTRGYAHAAIFVFRGELGGDADPAWAQDHDEIVEVAWIDPKELSAATTRPIHWPALQKAGLV